MPVPEFVHFIRPALEAHWGGEVREMGSVRAEVVAKLGLTPEDEAELVASGNTTKVYDRTQWALSYLRAARLLEQPKRKFNRITARGSDFLKTAPAVIRSEDLRQFEEFREFEKPKVKPSAFGAAMVVESASPTSTVTPEDALETSYSTLRSQLASDVLDRVKGMTPAFFERLIVELMLRLGYGGPSGDGRVLGRSGDGGVDGVINQDKLGLEKIYLQAKRYTSGSVGSPEVQGFAGALMGHGARKGVHHHVHLLDRRKGICCGTEGLQNLPNRRHRTRFAYDRSRPRRGPCTALRRQKDRLRFLHRVRSMNKTMHETLRGMLPHLRAKYGVGQLWIIGSRARGDHRPDSDLDLMVEFERRGISLFGFAGLELEIGDALGLKVDLVEEGAMKPRVARELEKDKVLV